LHLVGILFPHINDDARSKSHQTKRDGWLPPVAEIIALNASRFRQPEKSPLRTPLYTHTGSPINLADLRGV